MSFYKILVEPAKSSKGTCKVCNKAIEQDHLRLQVADDREFNDYIMKHGGRSMFQGEGMSRGGYIEAEEGCISIKRYFVHLDCYTPIRPHPYELDRFKLEHFSQRHREVFIAWLEKRKNEPARAALPEPAKKKRTSKKDSDDEEFGKRKTKKINKARGG